MNEYLLISYLSNVFWFLIPIKQYKTRYFNYFVSISILIISAEIIRFMGSSSNLSLLVLSAISTYFLHNKELLKKNKIKLMLVVLLVSIFSIFIDNKIFDNWLLLFIHLIALLLIIINFFNYSIINKSVTLFYLIFLFNQLLNVLRFINVVSYTQTGFFYFYASLLIQVFIGIFFLFVNEDTNKFILYRFKSNEEANN